jgi:putative membrane protein
MKTTVNLVAALILAASSVALGAESGLNDPQIATIALTAHQIDVARGEVAQKKTKNDAVRQLADQMVNDHSSGAKEVLALAKKLGVTPEKSAVSKSLEDGAKKTAAKLKRLKGAAFDKAYVDAEVDYHMAVIDAINKVLLPAVKNEEVKQALLNTTPMLQGHLVHAQQVQASLAMAK